MLGVAAGGLAFLTGEGCFDAFFSTGFFLVLFFWDFDKVAVDGVTGTFTGLAV